MKLLLTLLCLTVTLHAEIFPDEASCKPLTIGAAIPEATVIDAKGQKTSLKALMGGKPSVLVFFRGTWCPLCTLAMAHVAQAQPELEKMGYQIIAISSEAPEELAKFAPVTDATWTRPDAKPGETKRQIFERERLPEKALTYPVVTDPSGRLAEAMGIAFHKDLAGTEYEKLKKTTLIQQRDGKHWLPLPGVFLTDAQGILRFVDLNRKKDGTISKDYGRRLKADALIQAAKAATQSDMPIYEIPAATLPLDWKGFGKQELVEGVWQISELESDHHVSAPKIQLPAQDFIAEFEWRLPTAESAIFRLDVKTGHLGGLTWKPGADGKPGLLVLAQQDYDREKGPAKIEWLAKAATKAPRDEWMKVRFELIGGKLRVQAGEHLLEAEKASFAQEKTTLAITVAGGAAQLRGLKIWKAHSATPKP